MDRSSLPSHDFPDLNCGNEAEEENNHDALILEDTLMPNDDELIAANEVQSGDLTYEETEKRLEPGQVVENEHIAFALYCKYAKLKGFSVRKGRNVMFKDGSGLLQGKLFLCSCEGEKDRKSSKRRVPNYQKTTFRSDCKAKLKIARRKGDVWKVTVFNKEHNHELYPPDQAYLIRSARNLTDQQELIITTMVKSGIPMCKAIKFLENSANGRENLGFTVHDAYDRINRANRKTKMENGDTRELLQHFIDKSNNEYDFFWKMEVDDDDRLMNFFCRDYQCMIDYECFGDLLSFDTTYRTNKYELICAPFIGINHHHDNVMFGFALLSDETQSSFEWLFRMFLESMGGKQPGIVFTDQCQAMMKAVETIFPDAHHRLCHWHIKQNAPSHFGSLNGDSEFWQLWEKCMTGCESENEFETIWRKMMEDYDLGDEKWFKVMYKLRQKWATAFSNHLFSAGLLTTSRSEGTNSALKKKIGNCTSSLLNCVIQYEEVQKDWRVKEKEKSTLSRVNKPTPIVSSNPFLDHAANFYTPSIYQLFEKELLDVIGFELPRQFAYLNSSSIFFQVQPRDKSKKSGIVEYTKELEIKCSCRKFEIVGILCTHALKVLHCLDVHFIPDKYIKKRWTISARSEAYVDQSDGVSGKDRPRNGNSYLHQMAYVNHKIKEVRDVAMLGKDEEGRGILSRYIECARKEMIALNESKRLNDLNSCDNLVGGEENILLVKDSLIAKSRGINNVQRRHWDVKRKGKGKIISSKRIGRIAKKSVQNSQAIGEDCHFQKAANVGSSQGASNVQLPRETISSLVHGYGGEFNMGMKECVANVYPSVEFNMGVNL